jgi:pilus assembly protein FimV
MARDVNVGPAAEKKLERYGVWVKVEPRDVTRDLGGSFELTDLEPQTAGASPERGSFTNEEEHLLDELETGVGHEVAAGTQVELESLDERLSIPSSDEELPELELEDAVEVPLADHKPSAERFEDLEAIESEIPSEPSGASRQPEILSRIEKELRSIRTDLTALKKELADLRRPGAVAARAEPGAGAKAGFFEEEEDDTIALTGDELDNILNTADITEEAAEAPAAEADLAEVGDAGPLSDQSDILAYEEPAAAAEPVAEPLEELEEVADLELELPGDAPAELVLEDAAGAPAEAGELPALELEGIPELEGAGEAELEELPADDDTIADADLVADLEEVSATPGTEPGSTFPEVDLKALHATQDSGHESILSTDDLAESDLAELEAVAEESTPAAGASIEIDFEQAAAPVEAETGAEEVEALEAVEDLEEVAEVLEEAPAAEEPVRKPEPPRPVRQPESAPAAGQTLVMNESLKKDLRNVLGVIDELLDALPEKKIREFAKSEHFAVYKKLFEDLGLDTE